MALQVKICGLTTLDDALHACACGADLLGFIQYPRSPRYISPAAAGNIIRQLPEAVETVGVFVNETAEAIRCAADTAGFTTIQLHGTESRDLVESLAPLKVIKAFGLKVESDLEQLVAWKGIPILVDTPCPEHGGSGQVGDWELAATVARAHTMFLAGGLTPENVADAVRHVDPFGVDVSSGVESSKGIKDPHKVQQFIQNARGVELCS